jgi:hypothetical protein
MPNGAGYYYLHTNGDLIFKRFEPEQEAGGFVRKVWRIDPSDRGNAWLIAIEALAMGARRDRVMELAAHWGLTDEDAQEFVRRATAKGKPTFKLWRDGDKWCAGFNDFGNIQESQCGFGTTALEALAELARPGLDHALRAPAGP